MYGLVALAIGGIISFGAYAHQAHYDTLGYLMMVAGVFIMIGGAFAMLGACKEKSWSIKLVQCFAGLIGSSLTTILGTSLLANQPSNDDWCSCICG